MAPRSIILATVFSALLVPAPAQDLQHGEYFFDIDPGFGNGFPVTFPAAAQVDLQLPVPVSGLSSGHHALFFRMKDEAGHWGLTNRRHVLVRTMPAGGDIVYLEYFLDQDPGLGNGTSVPFTAAPVITDLPFDLTTDTLAAGVHTLFVRCASEHDAWSLTHAHPFDVLVGIDELSDLGIQAGPNPLVNELVLQRPVVNGAWEIDLLDTHGARVLSTTWTNGRLVIDLSDKAPGIYLLQLRQPARTPVVVRLVKV